MHDLDEDPRGVRRILPLLTVRSFRSETDVERMADELPDLFFDHGLSKSLVQDTATVLAEAANNVVQHAGSAVGGFAVVQQRYMQSQGLRTDYIEIAVADPGRGIAESLGREPADAEAAIIDAVKEGTTSTGDRHRGIGLHELSDLVEGSPGRLLEIHSDHGFYQTGQSIGPDSMTVANRFRGTAVTVVMVA
ncbi:MAG: hypothetical protein O3A10_14250 [Chloroflexi bacterium]|nr:hypothetical protein [Chloroflexota bacterium]MDA1146119.1 hypothetical protein [Chloroflexota bacterium]